MKTLLFYDISELGWVRYLSAHINYLKKQGNRIAICTNKSREVFYRGCVDEILPIPDKYYELFGKFQSDGNCLYDTEKNEIISDHDLISQPFKDAYPNYDVITEYSMFYNQRIFEPYKHSKKSEKFCKKFNKVILVFPRYRESKFSRRNIKKEYWVELIEKLCETYPDMSVITMGGLDSTFNINLDNKNYHNLISNKDVLDILVCLCNTGKVISTFGTESGISLVATICKSNSFIIGQDKERIGYENFCNANIFCYRAFETENGYKIDNFNNVINEFIKFISLIIFLSKNKYL